MDQLIAVAERLREVRRARRVFLLRWAEESLASKSRSIQELCMDSGSDNTEEQVVDKLLHQSGLSRLGRFDD